MFGADDAALAILASGAISTAGSLYSNQANLRNQRLLNDINWRMNAENNATQILMANTAHQREVNDLRAAGLNPILSAGGNGASTPSLTNMRGETATVQNPLEGLASSARGLKDYIGQSYQASLQQAKADASSAESDALQASWDASLARQRANVESQDLDLRERAIEDLTTKYVKQDGVWRKVFDSNSPYYKLYKEGLEAEAADRSNVNWRNNLNAGLGVVNSATSLGLGVGRLRHATRLLQKTRR